MLCRCFAQSNTAGVSILFPLLSACGGTLNLNSNGAGFPTIDLRSLRAAGAITINAAVTALSLDRLQSATSITITSCNQVPYWRALAHNADHCVIRS